MLSSEAFTIVLERIGEYGLSLVMSELHNEVREPIFMGIWAESMLGTIFKGSRRERSREGP